MEKLKFKMKNQLPIIASMICFVLFINACATFKRPVTINEDPILERALTKEAKGIRVSVAVVGEQEAKQILRSMDALEPRAPAPPADADADEDPMVDRRPFHDVDQGPPMRIRLLMSTC